MNLNFIDSTEISNIEQFFLKLKNFWQGAPGSLYEISIFRCGIHSDAHSKKETIGINSYKDIIEWINQDSNCFFMISNNNTLNYQISDIGRSVPSVTITVKRKTQNEESFPVRQMFEIRNLLNETICSFEAENFEAAVKMAVAKNINLWGANLEKADLQGADLRSINLRGASLWRADLRGANLQNTNFGEADLEETDLQEANLQGVNLQGVNLQGANLRGANLRRAIFRGAILRGADLRGANLQEADLQEANLQGVNLKKVNLQGVNFQEVNLCGANLEGANIQCTNLEGANIQYANLEGANLLGSILVNANLEGANLLGANLQGVNIWNANLQKANLVGTILDPKVLKTDDLNTHSALQVFEIKHISGKIIWNCEAESFKDAVELAVAQNINLEAANLQGANLQGANLQGANLREANLQGANLQGANLQGANLHETNFYKTNLERANFKEALYLYRADFKEANLREANLREADLSGANLPGANLERANLEAANLKYANLEGANLEEAYLKDSNLLGANVKGANFVGTILEYLKTNSQMTNLEDSINYTTTNSTQKEQKMTISEKAKEHGSNVLNSILEGSKQGAVDHIGNQLVEAAKVLFKDQPTILVLLETQAGKEVVKGLMAAILQIASKEAPHLVPGAKYINAACDKQLVAVGANGTKLIMENLQPILFSLGPLLTDLANEGKKIAGVSEEKEEMEIKARVEDILARENEQIQKQEQMLSELTELKNQLKLTQMKIEK
jgi:uncharacterized protein YjbI with pentapeptide repeats